MNLLKWLPALVWVIIICWLSFSSLERVEVPNLLGVDKFAHIIMYSVLGGFIYLPLKKKQKQYLYFMLLAVIFGGLTEFIQHYCVTNRHGDIGDFTANCIGLFIAYGIKKRLQKT